MAEGVRSYAIHGWWPGALVKDSPVPGHHGWRRTVNQTLVLTTPYSDSLPQVRLLWQGRLDQGSILCLIFISHKPFLILAGFLLIIPFCKFGTLNSALFDD